MHLLKVELTQLRFQLPCIFSNLSCPPYPTYESKFSWICWPITTRFTSFKSLFFSSIIVLCILLENLWKFRIRSFQIGYWDDFANFHSIYIFYSLTLTILLFMTKLPAVHELIYEEKARKSLDFHIMEIHVQLIIKRKNISKESKIIWSFYKNSIQVRIHDCIYFNYTSANSFLDYST